jgi:hypothetical protein
MPCVPGQQNGGRAQHRLQYLSAFGADRRFALDSRLGAAAPARNPGTRLCGKDHGHAGVPRVAGKPPQYTGRKQVPHGPKSEYREGSISLVRGRYRGYICTHRLGTVLDAVTRGQGVGPHGHAHGCTGFVVCELPR